MKRRLVYPSTERMADVLEGRTAPQPNTDIIWERTPRERCVIDLTDDGCTCHMGHPPCGFCLTRCAGCLAGGDPDRLDDDGICPDCVLLIAAHAHCSGCHHGGEGMPSCAFLIADGTRSQGLTRNWQAAVKRGVAAIDCAVFEVP